MRRYDSWEAGPVADAVIAAIWADTENLDLDQPTPPSRCYLPRQISRDTSSAGSSAPGSARSGSLGYTTLDHQGSCQSSRSSE